MALARNATIHFSLSALVVDADADGRLALRLGLTAAGWRVTEASTGAQAVTTAERDLPDAIVLDLGLADMDGREVLAGLASTPAAASIPVVVLAGRTDRANVGDLLRAGARDYVLKPFSMDELGTRLASAQRTAVAERALRDSGRALAAAEQRWKTAFEAAPLGVAEMALDGRFVHVNPVFCELLGYTADQLRTMTPADISHPDDADRVRSAIATSARTNEQITRVERRYVHADGRIVTCLVSGVPVHDGSGRRDRLLAYFEDVSERKVNEQLLVDERRRLLDAQTVGRIGSWELEVATNTVTWSDTLLKMRGVERETFAGDYAKALVRIHEDDRTMVETAIQECIATGVPMHTRYRVVRVDGGALTWNDSRAEALYENGRVQRVAGTIVDVTEQVLAERSLQDSETRFGLAFDTAPVAMAMIDLAEGSSHLLRVNMAMCYLTGRTEGELSTLDFGAISHPDDASRNSAMLARLRSGQAEVERGERRFPRPDGTTVWGELAMSVVAPTDGSRAWWPGPITSAQASGSRSRTNRAVRSRCWAAKRTAPCTAPRRPARTASPRPTTGTRPGPPASEHQVVKPESPMCCRML